METRIERVPPGPHKGCAFVSSPNSQRNCGPGHRRSRTLATQKGTDQNQETCKFKPICTNRLVQVVDLSHITPLKAHLVWQALRKTQSTSRR